MRKMFEIAAALGSCCLLAAPCIARAQGVAVGPHGGVNLDVGSLHLGADVVIDVAEVSPSVRLAVWPSYAHVFIDDGHDVELFGVDFPFVFPIERSVVTPFVGPGVGFAYYGDSTLKVNIIGGLFFATGSGVRPFTELAVRLVNGTFVDLLAGVLFEL